MYNLIAYAGMLADRGRTSAYARALESRVTPESVVLDIGTGPGIMALLACRAGAARVYAADPGEVIELAREAADASGFADRIRFIQAMTTDIDLPEQVDGIVAEIHGVLPLFGRSVVSIMDARARFLKAGGWIVPARETLWAAVVSAASTHRVIVDAWHTEYGFDFSGSRARAANQWRPLRLKPDDLLVQPRCWATLDYATVERPGIGGQASWSMGYAGVGHGLGVWFDSETAAGCRFSNAPGSDHVFSQAFFPWPEAIPLSAGDEIHVAIRADFDGDDYVWSWETRVTDPATGGVRNHFHQSSFLAQSFGSHQLRKRAHTFVPEITDEARIDRRILELMARKLTLGEIATMLVTEFPSRFENWDDALTRTGELSHRYSR